MMSYLGHDRAAILCTRAWGSEIEIASGRERERECQLRCWDCLTEILLWREKRRSEFVVHCFCLCRQPCLRILLFVWEFSFVFFYPCLCLPPFLSLRLLWSLWPLKRRSGKKKRESKKKKEGEAEVIVSSGFNLVRRNCWQTANLHKLNIFAYVHLGEGEKKKLFALIKHLKIKHIIHQFVISLSVAQTRVPRWH